MSNYEQEISFVNAGYNIPEFKSLTFNWGLCQHAFLYFQGPAIVEGKKIDSGACILYPGNVAHNYTTLNGFVNSYIGFFAPEEIFSKLSIKTGKIIYPHNCDEINAVIKEICCENNERRRGWDDAVRALILKLLVTISRGTETKRESAKINDLKEKMTDIRNIYLSNLKASSDIDSLILESGMSRTQFYRMYSSFFHTSPKEDLIWAKLMYAKKLLREKPNLKMYEIAYECGFKDVPHFFRLFKHRYGYTPKDYATAAHEAVDNSLNIQ